MTEISSRITEVKAMDLPSLRDEWQRHHGTPPARCLSRDLLIRGITYTLQEKAQGGLSKATRRRLQTLAKTFTRTGRITPKNATKVRPGAQLVREWQSRTYVVTGAHWSGPRFFGLKGRAGHT